MKGTQIEIGEFGWFQYAARRGGQLKAFNPCQLRANAQRAPERPRGAKSQQPPSAEPFAVSARSGCLRPIGGLQIQSLRDLRAVASHEKNSSNTGARTLGLTP